jgi:hypothetical protein
MARKTKYIQLNSGKSTLSLEPSYWHQIEYLAEKDGYGNWRDFFYAYILDDKPDDIPLASHVRKFITSELFIEYAKGKGKDKSWN